MNDEASDGVVDPVERARAAFLRACELDVAVRKPGNVSAVSAGHRMVAAQFLDSARAASTSLFAESARVGFRIEGAVRATLAAVQTNTNLGIVLLCAPIARAVEIAAPASSHDAPSALRQALEAVLAALDRVDAAAAFRAIAQAHPGGLGTAPAQDVHAEPEVDLREAMRLAAHRDRIALQYATGMAELFDVGLPALVPPPSGGQGITAAVQRIYLAWLATAPDSHIVRKHGEAVAQTVMNEAVDWRRRAVQGEDVDADPAFAAWDDALKRAAINPGTSADLTVATLMLAQCVGLRLPLP